MHFAAGALQNDLGIALGVDIKSYVLLTSEGKLFTRKLDTERNILSFFHFWWAEIKEVYQKKIYYYNIVSVYISPLVT